MNIELLDMLTYREAGQRLKLTKKTIERRVKEGRYLAYGKGAGRRLIVSSVLADIEKQIYGAGQQAAAQTEQQGTLLGAEERSA